MKKQPRSVPHDEKVVEWLRKNPKLALEYLRAVMEETDDPQLLLLALRRVAEARGGLAKVAQQAGIQRESLYRALSRNGNPRFSTLAAIVRAVGLRVTVEAA